MDTACHTNLQQLDGATLEKRQRVSIRTVRDTEGDQGGPRETKKHRGRPRNIEGDRETSRETYRVLTSLRSDVMGIGALMPHFHGVLVWDGGASAHEALCPYHLEILPSCLAAWRGGGLTCTCISTTKLILFIPVIQITVYKLY
jgi:hypothetical protein